MGSGIIPIRAMMDELTGSGYKGWFTVEHFGSRHMLQDAQKFIRYIFTL